MIDRLVETLSAAGKPTDLWTSQDGSRALVLPYGGRILGLFPPGVDHNFLWTHPSLDSPETANAFYASTEWHNSGGDRTWLSPEVDLFLPNYPSLNTYRQPREFDPGHYQLTREDNGLVLTNRFSTRLSRSGHTVELEISKRLSPALNPFRHRSAALPESVAYAGYTLHTHLQFADCSADHDPISLWSLLQLPHGGELLIPTFSHCPVTLYMGTIDSSDIAVSDHLVRYRMDAAGEAKCGLPSLYATGRAGYLLHSEGRASLVIRSFRLDPSGEYLDIPWQQPEALEAAAVQACNVNSNLGAFSELEYHSPAIGGSTGRCQSDDESQLWTFFGPSEAILSIARTLLSPEVSFS